jgi:D-alanyl-D-alanine dipeptidase
MKNILIDAARLSRTHCPQIIQCQLAYATKENFLGRIVDGYHHEALDLCLMTPKAAENLCKIQNELNKDGLGLFVFDAYRPLRAVRDFMNWFEQPPAGPYELARKAIHYPHLPKNELSKHGYVASDVSQHCFGATIDLSLIDLKIGQLLNMGTCFDYFDPISHATVTAEEIGIEAFNNRQLLAKVMQSYGFMPYEKEYWHFDGEKEVHEPIDIEIVHGNF